MYKIRPRMMPLQAPVVNLSFSMRCAKPTGRLLRGTRNGSTTSPAYGSCGDFSGCCGCHISARENQGAPKGRQPKGESGPGTHIFADFCRFSLIFGLLCKSRDLGVADLRRKPQETADFRRKPQKPADFCRNRFLPFAVSLLARS